MTNTSHQQPRLLRLDHQIIINRISPGSSVLDLGCGTGDLLAALVQEKRVRGQGIEIDEQAIYACVAKGLNVLHGDIDSGLSEYQDHAFDYVILNQSLQQVQHFENVLTDALRVGNQVIAGFPNFAYWRARFQLCFQGQAPITPSLPYTWYESPNVHFFSLADFLHFCQMKGILIAERMFIDGDRMVTFWPNLFANIGIFLLRKTMSPS